MGIALVLVVTLSGFVLFNTAQMVSEKSRVANAADAAVYSGLIWQARALNFQAYTNRAMVANQVSIAQLVSLSSWAEMHRLGSANIHTALSWVPVVGQFAAVYRIAARGLDAAIQPVVKNAISLIDSLNGVLSEAQQVMYVSTFMATPAIVKTVAQRNSPDFDAESAFAVASLADNVVRWSQFTRRYGVDQVAAMQRKADLIDRSRDAFVKRRNWNIGWYGIPGILQAKIAKFGETRLVRNAPPAGGDAGNAWAASPGQGATTWQWKAKDTMSLHIRVRKWFRMKHYEYPLGWASRYVGTEDCSQQDLIDARSPWNWGDTDVQIKPGCTPWDTYVNPRAERVADLFNEPIDAAYNGLRAYYDLRDLSRQNRDPRLRLLVQVDAPLNSVRTSSHIDGLGSPRPAARSGRRGGLTEEGLFHVADHVAGGASVSSVSAGEVYFKRPLYRGSGNVPLTVNGRVRHEYGSLFNPYWDVRLVSVPEDMRMAAWLLKAPGLEQGATRGVAQGGEAYRAQKARELQDLEVKRRELARLVDNATDPTFRQALERQLAAVETQKTAMQDRQATGPSDTGSQLDTAFTQGRQRAGQLRGGSGSLQSARSSIGRVRLPSYDARTVVRTAMGSGVNQRLVGPEAGNLVRDGVSRSLRQAAQNAAIRAATGGLAR